MHYLEEFDEEREEFFNKPTREMEWSRLSGARHRRVIFKPNVVENQAFQTYGSRTPIEETEFHLLKPGDHIGWHRPYLIWHHAIVVETDVRNKELLVIHYTMVRGKAVVAKQWINVDKDWGNLFRFDYSENITDENPPEVVLERAESRIGETSYNCLNNNCEHFATFCKTGGKRSRRVQLLWELFKL